MKIVKRSANNPEGIAVPEEKMPTNAGTTLQKTGQKFLLIGGWIYRLRSVLLAIPVVVAAFILAKENMEKLPEFVGINMQTTGEFAMMIERDVAVFLPLIVTAACLLMMFISRKVLYPWLISIFSLLIPLLLWFTNVFPQ